MPSNRTPAARPRPASSPFTDPAPREVAHFALGDRVTHDRYGLGRVIAVDEGAAVVVDFSPQRYRIAWPYAKLSQL